MQMCISSIFLFFSGGGGGWFCQLVFPAISPVSGAWLQMPGAFAVCGNGKTFYSSRATSLKFLGLFTGICKNKNVLGVLSS